MSETLLSYGVAPPSGMGRDADRDWATPTPSASTPSPIASATSAAPFATRSTRCTTRSARAPSSATTRPRRTAPRRPAGPHVRPAPRLTRSCRLARRSRADTACRVRPGCLIASLHVVPSRRRLRRAALRDAAPRQLLRRAAPAHRARQGRVAPRRGVLLPRRLPRPDDRPRRRRAEAEHARRGAGLPRARLRRAGGAPVRAEPRPADGRARLDPALPHAQERPREGRRVQGQGPARASMPTPACSRTPILQAADILVYWRSGPAARRAGRGGPEAEPRDQPATSRSASTRPSARPSPCPSR